MRKTIKKAQYGKRTPMQILKERFPKADTTAAGDLRFADLGNVARYPKKDQDYIRANQAAFDKKFGKGKPAKNQMGGKTPKASQAAKKMGPTYVKNPLREQQDFLMKQKAQKAGAKQQMGGVTKKAQKGKTIKKGQNGLKQFSRKSFQTADSLRAAKVPFSKDYMQKRKANMQKAAELEKEVEKRTGVPRQYNMYVQKAGGKTSKMRKYKNGGTLSPTKKSVGKTIGKLNKAKYGSKMSKKK